MGQVTIYGASDDLVEIEGDISGCDEYPADDAQFALSCKGDRHVRVRIAYTERGVWAITLSQVDDDIAMPPVAVQQHPQCAYSAMAVIDDVRLIIRERLADDD